MTSVTTKRLTVTNIRQTLQQLLDTYQREKAEIQQDNNTCFTGHWDSACQTIYDVVAALNISFEKQPGKPCLSTQRRHQPASRTPDNADGQLSGGHFLYHQTHWHAKDYYQPTLTKHAGLVEESRLFLLAYAQTKDHEAACDALLKSIQQEHSPAKCKAILRVICHRFVRWIPPDWVLDDLVTFARGDETDAFKAALLLHTARQDALLY